MQSLNEELQTVNAELQAKVEELSRTNNDMKNLLNSTDIAILFLDEALHVRCFTTPAAQMITTSKLLEEELRRARDALEGQLAHKTQEQAAALHAERVQREPKAGPNLSNGGES